MWEKTQRSGHLWCHGGALQNTCFTLRVQSVIQERNIAAPADLRKHKLFGAWLTPAEPCSVLLKRASLNLQQAQSDNSLCQLPLQKEESGCEGHLAQRKETTKKEEGEIEEEGWRGCQKKKNMTRSNGVLQKLKARSGKISSLRDKGGKWKTSYVL